jgi:steroid 5-alpha reductase family enzyme
MEFFSVWAAGLLVIMAFMTLLWVVSVILKNASIVDPFWGTGFVITAFYWYLILPETGIRGTVVLILVTLWGLRLSLHLFVRNFGKGEDFRYQNFRKSYGEKRYWWVSFFQVYLLQGVLMWLVSATLLGAMNSGASNGFGLADFFAAALWAIGFIFEAGGDLQLVRFKKDPLNKGKLLTTGFWGLTRHPNYFGDSAVWWGFALFSIAAGSYLAAIGSVIMTVLLIKVSGVALLEKTLIETKPGYREYANRTSAFIPWFPRKN